MNTSGDGNNDEIAGSTIKDIEWRMKLPVADPIREGDAGADRLAKAILDASAALKTPR